MRLLLFVITALQLPLAFAGRESHGLMPGGSAAFQCVSETQVVHMPAKDGLISTATLHLAGENPVNFNCEDRSQSLKRKQTLRLTVICEAIGNEPYRLELRESANNAKVKIWNLEQNDFSEVNCF